MNFRVKPTPGGADHFGGLPPFPGGGPQPGPDGGALDIRALLLPAWRHKWLILLVTTLTFGLTILAALRMESEYTASARVIFDPERLRIIDLDNVVVSPDVSHTGLQNQVEILRSAVLLDRVIDTLRLEGVPEFNTTLRSGSGSLLERGLDLVNAPPRVHSLLAKLGLVPAPEPWDLTVEERAERQRGATLATLMDRLQLRPIPNSRVIDISVTSANPRLAAAIANAVGQQYIIVQIEAKRDDIVAASELLSVRVADLENRYNVAEEAVRMAHLELSMRSEHGSAMISPQIEMLNTTLTETRLARAALESRHARAAEAVETGRDFDIVGDFRGSPRIQAYRAQEIELQNEAAAMRAIVGQTNPGLTRLEARIAQIAVNIEAEARTIVAALADDLRGVVAQEATLDEELRKLQAGALEQSRVEMRLSRLTREAEASRAIYESFLSRMKEASEQASLQTPDARFLTRATPPGAANLGTRLKIVLVGLVGGILASAGLVFLLEQLSNTFRNPSDVEAQTGLPVLAAIPHAGRRKQPKELIAYLLKKPNSALAESVRNLRTSIFFSNIDRPPKVVMFSSSLPMEGKTTTAMLAAITSRQMGRSAVIIDCDLRRQTLSSIFPTDADQPGLFAVLEGTASLDDAVYKEPETGLHVLAPGRAHEGHGNPADILASQRFQKLINELRARYDLVILDTPPTLVVTDARIVAQFADAVVYLVRWDHTRKVAVTEGLRELASVNANVAGIALSLVSEARAANFANSDYLYKQSYRNYVTS